MQIEPLSSCCCCSSQLRSGCHITLECSIVHLGAGVVQEWHHWLVHGTVPLDVSWSSVSVSVHILVVLMEDWLLPGSPLTVGIWDWWVLWKNTGESPVQQVWVVLQGLEMPWMVVENNWAVLEKTTATTSDAVVDNPDVGESASCIEVLDWEFTDGSESKEKSQLGVGGVGCEVEAGLMHWSGDMSGLVSWEPLFDLFTSN